jgi:hypothetical protein
MAVLERDKPLPRTASECFVPPLPLNSMLEFGRQWVPVGTEAAGIVSRGMGELNRLHVEALNDLLAQHSRAAARLRGNATPAVLMETQVEGLRFAWERGLRCWMDLAGAAAEMQGELAACSEHLVSTEDLFAGARLLHA